MSGHAVCAMVWTDAARRFARRLLRFAPGPDAGLRLRVAPGGCSGPAAHFDLCDRPAQDELVWEDAGLRVFLDDASRGLLDGATVDFKDSLSETGFVVTRPGEAFSTCGQTAPLVAIGPAITR